MRGGPPSGQCLPDPTIALAHQADFIGFVEGHVSITNPTGEWTQGLWTSTVMPIKGEMEGPRGLRADRPGNYFYSVMVWGGHILPADSTAAKEAETVAHWPTWFGEQGVYLVFLQQDSKGAYESWSSLAVFPVEYHPKTTGKIVTTIGRGEDQGAKHPVLSMDNVQVQLKRILANDADTAVAGKKLTAVFQPMMICGNTRPSLVSFEQRFEEAQKLVAGFCLGARKKNVEQVFRKQYVGLSNATQVCYYLGSEVMVQVSYDAKERLNAPMQIVRHSVNGT